MRVQTPDLKQLIQSAIEKHLAASDNISVLDELSEHLSQFISSIDEISTKKELHFRKTASRYSRLLEQSLFVVLVCRRKIDAILKLLEYSIDTKNSIALAQGARSLLEHVAVQAEVSKSLHSLEDNLNGQTDSVKIHDAILKAEKFIHRAYNGKSPKVENKKENQALHVNDCIKTLKIELSDIGDNYDYLCEYVHPNYGSNRLVSCSEHKLVIKPIVGDLDTDETRKMMETVITLIEASEGIDFKEHKVLARLSVYAQRFLQSKSKITNVFSVRKVKPEGDGKSKETAYFFPVVRDVPESIQLFLTYLKNRKIRVIGHHVNAFEDGLIYEIYETKIGNIWFKVDHNI